MIYPISGKSLNQSVLLDSYFYQNAPFPHFLISYTITENRFDTIFQEKRYNAYFYGYVIKVTSDQLRSFSHLLPNVEPIFGLDRPYRGRGLQSNYRMGLFDISGTHINLNAITEGYRLLPLYMSSISDPSRETSDRWESPVAQQRMQFLEDIAPIIEAIHSKYNAIYDSLVRRLNDFMKNEPQEGNHTDKNPQGLLENWMYGLSGQHNRFNSRTTSPTIMEFIDENKDQLSAYIDIDETVEVLDDIKQLYSHVSTGLRDLGLLTYDRTTFFLYLILSASRVIPIYGAGKVESIRSNQKTTISQPSVTNFMEKFLINSYQPILNPKLYDDYIISYQNNQFFFSSIPDEMVMISFSTHYSFRDVSFPTQDIFYAAWYLTENIDKSTSQSERDFITHAIEQELPIQRNEAIGIKSLRRVLSEEMIKFGKRNMEYWKKKKLDDHSFG